MEKGISLYWAKWLRPDPRTEPTETKASGFYMTSDINKNKAHDKGFDDALMKDFGGYIAECTAANIFLVIKREVYTSDPYCFLDGITRQTIIDIVKQKNYKVHVRNIWPDELNEADEVFKTGTAAEITATSSSSSSSAVCALAGSALGVLGAGSST